MSRRETLATPPAHAEHVPDGIRQDSLLDNIPNGTYIESLSENHPQIKFWLLTFHMHVL